MNPNNALPFKAFPCHIRNRVIGRSSAEPPWSCWFSAFSLGLGPRGHRIGTVIGTKKKSLLLLVFIFRLPCSVGLPRYRVHGEVRLGSLHVRTRLMVEFRRAKETSPQTKRRRGPLSSVERLCCKSVVVRTRSRFLSGPCSSHLP